LAEISEPITFAKDLSEEDVGSLWNLDARTLGNELIVPIITPPSDR
jgi:hypothetical protein